VVVLTDYFHDEWNEGFNHNQSASFIVAPLLEQVHELLAKLALVVMIAEYKQQLWSNLWRDDLNDIWTHL